MEADPGRWRPVRQRDCRPREGKRRRLGASSRWSSSTPSFRWRANRSSISCHRSTRQHSGRVQKRRAKVGASSLTAGTLCPANQETDDQATRRNHTRAFKAKVAIATCERVSVRGDKICRETVCASQGPGGICIFDSRSNRYFNETGGTRWLLHFGYERSEDWWKE
jgi:hypothetical protein